MSLALETECQLTEPAQYWNPPSAGGDRLGAAVHRAVHRRPFFTSKTTPRILKLIEQLIARRPDIRLLSARDGSVGIELARANRPDVILMDINLPGISGIEALKILSREDPETMHIPVVALSANAMPRDIEKGLQAGFFRYLTKPIKVDEFMETLGVALEFAAREKSWSAQPTF